MRTYICAVLLSFASVVTVASEEQAPRPGTFCWPMHFAGVVAGISQDRHVVRLLGQGAHRPKEEEGVRYYVDARRSATLRVATFTDRIVGEIALEAGINSTLSKAEIRAAMSASLSPREGFGNWHALTLGVTKETVLKNMGEPARRASDDEWTYDALCTCEIPEYMTIHFNSNKVVRVVFSAPPG